MWIPSLLTLQVLYKTRYKLIHSKDAKLIFVEEDLEMI